LLRPNSPGVVPGAEIRCKQIGVVWYVVVSVVNILGGCWLRLPGCRSGVFRCSPPTELPRCLSIFPSKRFHHSPRAQTQNFRCSHSSYCSPRSTRDAANSSSIAKTYLHLPSSPPPNGLANSAENYHITWSRVASSHQSYYNSCDTQEKPHCTHAHTVLHTRVTALASRKDAS
jgi:hypothetical protein